MTSGLRAAPGSFKRVWKSDLQRGVDIPVGVDYIPLFLPIGVEYEVVFSRLESRLVEIDCALNPEFKPADG